MNQLLEKAKPLFSNLVELDSGAITAGGQHDVTPSLSASYICDAYAPTWNVEYVRSLLTKAIEEYNKIYPRITLPLYNTVVQQICRIGVCLVYRRPA